MWSGRLTMGCAIPESLISSGCRHPRGASVACDAVRKDASRASSAPVESGCRKRASIKATCRPASRARGGHARSRGRTVRARAPRCPDRSSPPSEPAVLELERQLLAPGGQAHRRGCRLDQLGEESLRLRGCAHLQGFTPWGPDSPRLGSPGEALAPVRTYVAPSALPPPAPATESPHLRGLSVWAGLDSNQRPWD